MITDVISRSITRKVLLTVGVCLFMTLTVFMLYIEFQSYQFQLNQLRHQQQRITEGQAILISDQVAEGETDEAYLTLSGILANPAIVGVTLNYDHDFEDITIGEVQGPVSYSQPIMYLDDNLELSQAAQITTFATTKHIDNTLKNRIGYYAGLLCVLLISILSITALVLRTIVGTPLSLIVDAIEKSDIDRTSQISWNSKDEMGVVVQRLNNLHMSQQQRVVGLKQELSESELRETERLQNLANASFEAIIIYHNNQILDINNRMVEMLGMSKEYLLTRNLKTVFKPCLVGNLNKPLNGQENHYGNCKLSSENGSKIPVEYYVSDFSYGSINARVAVMRDITDRLEAEKNIRFLAHHDGLTKLPNRTSFMKKLDSSINEASTDKPFLSVMYLDLDKFKTVNDIYGHSAGDALLRKVAERLQKSVGPGNYVTRLGGDEFAVILNGANREEVQPEHIASELINAVSSCRDKCKVGHDFGASIGVAISEDAALANNEELLGQADIALYHAKNSGRNNYQLYTTDLDQELKRHRLLVERLLIAIENDELEMYYQPQAHADTEEICGFEALLRWNDKELGHVSPEEIVKAAEKERITPKLSNWILNTACAEAVRWPEKYTIAINLTPSDFSNANLQKSLAEILRNTGLPAERLELEITENAIISDMEGTTSTIRQLKEMGVCIALDDFGTGYSSLSFLQQLPFDRIKLDRSFVNTSDEESHKITAAIINLGKELDVLVIAEGIENLEQLQRMRKQKCDLIQGYYLSRPMPECKIADYIDQLDQFRLAG